MRRLLAGISLLAFFSACSSAPPAPAPASAPAVTPASDDQSFRATAPDPLPTRPWEFPRVTRVTLENGLRVLVAENHGAPLVTMRAMVRSGADHDPQTHAGLAAFTAAMLDEGAGGRTALEIAEAVADLGGALNTGSEWDASFVNLKVLSRNAEAGMNLLSDVLIRPTLPADEIERLRKERLTTILQQRDNANAIAANRFASFVYGGTPYGNPMIGTEQTVGRISRADLNDFYRTHYVPNNVSLIITGAVNSNDAVQMARRYFSSWPRGRDIPSVTVTPQSIDANRIYLIDRPQAVQSEIRVGHPGVSRSSEDYFPLFAMNTLLGGNFSSRMNLNLREKHGFTYGARTQLFFRRQPGPFMVSTPVRNEVTLPAVQQIMAELERIRSGDITDLELRNTKNYLMGVFPATVESADDLANRLGELEVYSLPEDYFSNYRERIAAVTADDLTRVANRYVHPDKAAIVIVGKASDIREPLGQLGYPLTVYDIDGQPIGQ